MIVGGHFLSAWWKPLMRPFENGWTKKKLGWLDHGWRGLQPLPAVRQRKECGWVQGVSAHRSLLASPPPNLWSQSSMAHQLRSFLPASFLLQLGSPSHPACAFRLQGGWLPLKKGKWVSWQLCADGAPLTHHKLAGASGFAPQVPWHLGGCRVAWMPRRQAWGGVQRPACWSQQEE